MDKMSTCSKRVIFFVSYWAGLVNELQLYSCITIIKALFLVRCSQIIFDRKNLFENLHVCKVRVMSF